MSSSAKSNILYFILGSYIVNALMCPFLDHTQCSIYYWYGSTFKMPRFFFGGGFISISRCLYKLVLLYSLTDMLLSVGTDISIRTHVFLLDSLTTISDQLRFIFLSVSIAKS